MQATRETFRHLSLTGQFYQAAFDGARRLGPPALREAGAGRGSRQPSRGGRG